LDATAVGRQDKIPWLEELASRSWPAHVLAVLLLASVLRLPTLAKRSLWFDEIKVALAGLQGFEPAVRIAKAHADATPLDYLLVSASVNVFGRGEAAVRLPAAVCGLAAVAAIYFLGRAMAGHWVGLVASLLLAISPGHVWYSQEARFYSVLMLLSIVSTLAFLVAVQRQRWYAWAAYALTVALGLYAGYQIALVVLLHVVALLAGGALRWWRLPAISWLHAGAALGAAALLFLPWYVWDQTGQQYAYGAPPFRDLTMALYWVLANQAPTITSHLPMDAPWFIWEFVLVTALIGGGVAIWRRDALLLATSIAVVGLPLLVLLILRDQSYVFGARHMMVVVPMICLVVGYVSVQLMRVKALVPIGLVLLVGFVAMSVAGLEFQRGIEDKGEDWRGAARYLRSNMAEDDRLAAFYYDVLRYYGDLGQVESVSTPDEIRQFVDETPGRAWIFTTHRQWRAPFWKDLAPVLNSDDFEETRFPGIIIFVSVRDGERQAAGP